MSFVSTARAEWVKFRTVRGWLIGALTAVLLIVLLSAFSTAGERTNCRPHGCPDIPVGPGGAAVADSFYFVHRTLPTNGTITVRVGSFSGLLPPTGHAFGTPIPPAVPLSAGHPGLQPWSKAGLIVAASTRQGASYAAVMVTGRHGVRMQYDYTHDIAGSNSARWLRLVRSGARITSYQSTDGTQWRMVGRVRLAALSNVVQAGMFVTSPQEAQATDHPFVTQTSDGPTLATARFDHVTSTGSWSDQPWIGTDIGAPDHGYPALAGGFHVTASGVEISGSGDIAPQVGGVEAVGLTIDHALAGGFAGLIALIVLGTVFATAEYRRGLIHVSFMASPRRGRVLAAKVLVIGCVSFAVGLVGSALSVLLGERILRANHNRIYPVSTVTELRVVVGTAAFLAVVAVASVALGMVLRRSTSVITTVVVAVILPYLLYPGLPDTAAEWLLRVSPAAAFAVQQTVPVYSQVDNLYTPANGYYPLAPWAGFAVLCPYAVGLVLLAVLVNRRQDA